MSNLRVYLVFISLAFLGINVSLAAGESGAHSDPEGYESESDSEGSDFESELETSETKLEQAELSRPRMKRVTRMTYV